MAGETEEKPSGWTVDTLFHHLRAMREADIRFGDERDRRYAELAIEREKALKIKEIADETARLLVAETQKYKDEKGNELRSQIERERGAYVTQDQLAAAVARLEAVIQPLANYVTRNQGGSSALDRTWGYIVGAVGLAGAVIAVLVAVN